MPHTRLICSHAHLAPSAEFQHPARLQESPLHNQLLAALPEQDLARLWPLMKSVDLPRGTLVLGAEGGRDQVYFPTRGIFVRCIETLSGETIGFGLTGSEGAVGVAAILGSERTQSATLTLAPTHAYRIAAATLLSELEHDGPFTRALLRYVQLIIAELGQNVVCNRFHTVEQQLCRWLLSCLDRTIGNVLLLTHETLGNQLGVRRESVTGAAHKLQIAGALDCRRGRITIHDRPLLETRACECYENVKREQARLFPRGVATIRRLNRREPALGHA